MSSNNKNKDFMRYAGLGSQMMATLGVMTWLGWYLDKKTSWNFPLFIIILPLIGLIIALWQLIKAFNKPKK